MATSYGSILLQWFITMEKLAQDPGYIQFINSIDYNQYEKVMSCNNIVNNILQKGDKEIVWELKGITAHKEPLVVSLPNYKWVWYNVTVEWEIGETITDPLSILTLDHPFICALYKNDKDLFMTMTHIIMLRFIGVKLNHPLIKYGKVLIYASFRESNPKDFVSFH